MGRVAARRIVWVALGLLPAAAGRSGLDGSEILARVNARPLGETQYRSVQLSILDGDAVKHELRIATFRRSDGSRSRAAFLLKLPNALAGTAFLVDEPSPPQASRCRIWLYLPFGKMEVRELLPSQFAEGLLGSDFTYQDWRLWIPVQDLRASRAGEATVSGRSCYVVDAKPRNSSTIAALGWRRARYFVDRQTWVPVRIEYYGSTGPAPQRVLLLEDLRRIDGVWLPSRMVMRRHGSAQRTEAKLLDGWHDRSLPSTWLMPERLPDLLDLTAARRRSGAGPSASTESRGAGRGSPSRSRSRLSRHDSRSPDLAWAGSAGRPKHPR